MKTAIVVFDITADQARNISQQPNIKGYLDDLVAKGFFTSEPGETYFQEKYRNAKPIKLDKLGPLNDYFFIINDFGDVLVHQAQKPE